MLRNKSIKKFILLSLFIVLPIQTITMPSRFSFSSIKKNLEQIFLGISIADISKIFKKYKTTVAITVGGCAVTCLAAVLYYKKRRKERRAKAKEKEAEEKRIATAKKEEERKAEEAQKQQEKRAR